MKHCSLFLPPLCPTPMSHFLPGICWDALSQVVYPTTLYVKWGHFIDQTEVATGQTNPQKNLGCTRETTSALIVPAARLH